ncbi:hypothetical protein Hanom_Chr01g00011501 [Helianthus anomalus]
MGLWPHYCCCGGEKICNRWPVLMLDDSPSRCFGTSEFWEDAAFKESIRACKIKISKDITMVSLVSYLLYC